MRRLTLLVLTLIGLSCALPFPAIGQESGIVGTWTIPMEFKGKIVILYIRFDVDGRYWQWSPGYPGSTQGTYSTYENELKIVRTDGKEMHSHFYLTGPKILTLQGSTGRFQYDRVADALPEPTEKDIARQDSNLEPNQQQPQPTDTYGANTEAGNSDQMQDTPYELGCKLFAAGRLKRRACCF